jgi:hypothetical protein
MRKLTIIVGVLAILLGGLWLLQGLGVVRIRPILCVANCAPVQGPSTGWAIAGAIVLGLGIAAVVRSRRGHPQPPDAGSK